MRLSSSYFPVIAFGFAVALYVQTWFYQYALDDYLIILDNEIVLAGLSKLQEIFTTPMTWGVGYNDGLYRPIALFSHALEVSLIGEHSMFLGHFMNTIYYGFLCLILFKVLNLLFPTNEVLNLGITLLFAAHPLHTEVVANIKSRDEILGLLFSLWSLFFFLAYKNSSQVKHMLFGAVLFFLALLSKESTLVFLILIPIAFVKQWNKSEVKPVLVSFGVLLLPAIIYLWLRNQAITVWVPPVDITNMYSKLANSLAPAHGLEKFGMASYLVAKYFLMGVFPIHQAYEYSYNMIPILPFSNPIILGSVVLNLALIGYMVYGLLKKQKPAIGVLFFYATIALFSNLFILIGVTFAERFAFMSSLGTLVFLIYALNLVKVKFQLEPKYVTVFMGILLTAYSVKTIARSTVWENNETLFIGDYANNQNSVKAKYNAGTQYSRLSRQTTNQSKVNEYRRLAIEKYEEAIELYPNYKDAVNNLGNIYLETDEFNKAIHLFNQNLANNNANVNSIYNRAVAYFELENYMMAQSDFEWYLSLDRYGLPNKPLAYYFLGQCYGFNGNFSKAISALSKAVELNPNYWEAWQSMGKAYGMQGDFISAEKHLLTALNHSPNNEGVLFDLAITYLNAGKKQKAKTIISQLIALAPNNATYKEMMASIS